MNNKVIAKDIFTTAFDNYQNNKNFSQNFNYGVWTGIRPISNLLYGVSNIMLRAFNIDGVHMAIRINGISYTLGNDLGDYIFLEKIINSKSDNDGFYEWYYKGISRRTDEEVEMVLEMLNNCKIKYNLITKNC